MSAIRRAPSGDKPTFTGVDESTADDRGELDGNDPIFDAVVRVCRNVSPGRVDKDRVNGVLDSDTRSFEATMPSIDSFDASLSGVTDDDIRADDVPCTEFLAADDKG